MPVWIVGAGEKATAAAVVAVISSVNLPPRTFVI
jgi:hypothetical protein